jgi:hypothetical protein
MEQSFLNFTNRSILTVFPADDTFFKTLLARAIRNIVLLAKAEDSNELKLESEIRRVNSNTIDIVFTSSSRRRGRLTYMFWSTPSYSAKASSTESSSRIYKKILV